LVGEIDGGWQILDYGRINGDRSREAELESKRKYINGRRARERMERAGGGVERQLPTLEWCLNWVAGARANGADYTDEEVRKAFPSLAASGWMCGGQPIYDYRAGMARCIEGWRREKVGRQDAPTIGVRPGMEEPALDTAGDI